MRKLDRDHWRAMLPIIQAFVDGKTIRLWGDDELDRKEMCFDCPANSYTIVEPPRYRPFTVCELRSLVGRSIVHVASNQARLVLGESTRGNALVVYGDHLPVEACRLKDEYTLDGKPCGVLEE